MDFSHILKVIYPCLVILYLIDGIVYIRKYHLLFVSLIGNRFQLKDSGLHIIGFFPFSQVFLSHNLPFRLTDDGVYLSSNQNEPASIPLINTDYDYITYQDIEKVRADERVLKINDKLVRMHSAKYAQYMRDLIDKLKSLSRAQRQQTILVFSSEVTDIEEIRVRRYIYYTSIRWLKIFVPILSFYFFLVLPLVLYSDIGVYFDLYRLLLPMLITYFCVLICEFVAHKKIYGGDTLARINILIRMLLSPVSSLHAVNILSRDLFWRFDYIALGAELLSTATFTKLVKRELWLADYLAVKADDDGLVDWWKLRKKYLISLVTEKGISQEDVLGSPTKEDESATRYCPLCASGYRSGFIVCSDCGVDLEDFK